MEIKQIFTIFKDKYHYLAFGLILLISIILRVYALDLSAPIVKDGFGAYLLKGLEVVGGDFSQMKTHAIGWGAFLGMFFKFIHFGDYFGYMKLQKIIALLLSIGSIIVFYGLAKKFLNDNLSLLATAFFAFEPHIIANSVDGMSEPLFMLIILSALYFAWSEYKYALYFSFILIGIAWWVRFNALFLFFIFIAIYLIKLWNKNKKSLILGALLCLLIISPSFIMRQIQFGNAFDYGVNSKYFNDSYAQVWYENIKPVSLTEFVYLRGVNGVIDKFVVKGIFKEIKDLAYILLPYLIIFIFAGIYFVWWRRNYYFWSLAVFGSLYILSLIPIYSIFGGPRHLLILLPIFSLVSAYFMDGIKFENKRNYNVLIGSLIVGVALLSFSVLIKDKMYIANQSIAWPEKMAVGKFVAGNIRGKIMGTNMEYTVIFFKDAHYVKTSNSAEIAGDKLATISLYASNFDQLIKEAKKYNVSYIAVGADGQYTDKYWPEIYDNESQYKNLQKVYDSNDQGLKLVKIKIFKIL